LGANVSWNLGSAVPSDNERLADCILDFAPEGDAIADIAIHRVKEESIGGFKQPMKRTIKLLALAAALAVFAIPAMAQNDQCTDENKDLWYTQTFLKNFKGTAEQQKLAYDAAKKYIASCPADQYSDYMQKKFVEPYEKLHANLDIAAQFQDAVKNKNNQQVLTLGEQIVATNPDNAAVIYILMASTGLNDANLLGRSSQAAKKAIELIEAGKPFEPAYKSKDQALAAMNYIIAKSMAQSAPADAIPYYLKALRYESDLKKTPQIYIELADAYEKGPGAKLTADYKSKIGPNNTETPESKLALENLNQITDRQIDALARAAALTTDATNKKAIVDDLTSLYKYRNKTATDANVSELVANVLSKPIPDVPTPITSLPGPSPSSNPATNGNGSSNGTSVNGGTNNGTKPAGNNMTSNTAATGKGTTSTGTGAQTGTAKPTATPTPQRKPLKFRRG
jgi:hypothetical protein